MERSRASPSHKQAKDHRRMKCICAIRRRCSVFFFARRGSFAHARRKSRRPPHVGLESIGVDQSEPAADGASGRDLDQALRLLSVEQREVVLLVGLEGLSYAETAEVLDIPVGTVMSRLARARAMLRAAWNAAETATTRPGPAIASGTAL